MKYYKLCTYDSSNMAPLVFYKNNSWFW